MIPKFFRGLRLVALVPLLAAVVGLGAAERASAIHKDGLDRVGLSVSTLFNDTGNPSGLLVQDVQPKSLAAASGLEVGDVIVEVDGAPAGTLADIEIAVTRAIRAGDPSLSLGVIDTRDPNAGPQPVSLPLQ